MYKYTSRNVALSYISRRTKRHNIDRLTPILVRGYKREIVMKIHLQKSMKTRFDLIDHNLSTMTRTHIIHGLFLCLKASISDIIKTLICHVFE